MTGSPFLFLRVFLPLALLLIAGAGFYGNQAIERELTQIRNQEAANIKLGTGALSSKIEFIRHDLMFLSRHSALRDAIDQTSPKNLMHLAEDFSVFSESRGHYDQIRWIDQNGMEVVRVDYVQGKPVVVPAGKLQDKSQRYFFTDTIRLNPGEVFISPLDLNIEQNRIEVPYKPMVRIATPISDRQGNKRGIVILNYHGKDLLQAFANETASISDHSMVINSEGYWLKSPRPADEWGFMFKRPEQSMAVRAPAAWERIRSADKGQLELDDGLWTWETVYPLQAGRKTSLGAADAFAPSRGEMEYRQYFWKSVAHLSADTLSAIRQAIWLKVAWIAGLLLSLAGTGSWLLTRSWEMLTAEKKKFGTVADFTYAWETWLDPNGHYLYCSPSCTRITGRSADAFLADPNLLLSITHPDDRARLEMHLQRHKASDPPCEFDFRIVLQDGQIRWLEHTCQSVLSESGEFLGRRASSRDITERKQAQAALRESEELLKEAQKISRIGNWELDLVKDKLLWSDEIFRLFEIDPDKLQATYEGFLNAIHPDDRDAVNSAYTRSLETREPYEITHRLQMSDGRIKWVTERCSSSFDAEGKPIRSIGTVQDLTERMQAETALHESHQQMASLLNSMAEGAYGVDINGNCTFVNRSFLRILGYEHTDEIIGKHIHELIHHSRPDGSPYPATECKMYNAYRRNQEIHVSDEVFWNKDGVAIPVEYWSQPILVDEVMQGAVATFIDITERKLAEEELELFRLIVEKTGDAIFMIDDDDGCRMMYVNEAAVTHYGATREEILAWRIPDWDPNFSYEMLAQHVEEIKKLKNLTIESLHRVKGGSIVPVEISLNHVFYKGRHCHFGYVRNISERKQVEAELRIAATAFESAEGMMIADANSVILRVNHAFTEITGYTAEEAVGQTPRLLKSGRHDAVFYATMWENIRRNGSWQGEIWNRRKNGEVYPELLTITAVRGEAGEVTNYVATLDDITLRKAAEEQIRNLAFYDTLTQLPNRRLLNDRLGHAMSSSKRSGRYGALMFLDLDNFKPLNDMYGHAVGDLLLIEVARRISGCVRETDTLARFGGDEFVMILSELDADKTESTAQAGIVAEKIRAALAEPYLLTISQKGGAERTVEHHCTSSIGVVLFISHEASQDDILKWADAAMYKAKESGRNQIHFNDSNT